MKRFFQRLRRLWGQSRIRLSATDFPDRRIGEVRTGDRLQIGPRWWRVRRFLAGGHAGVFELAGEASSGTPQPGVRLCAPRDGAIAARDGAPRDAIVALRAEGRQIWLLEDGTDPVPLRWRDVLHFPAGSQD